MSEVAARAGHEPRRQGLLRGIIITAAMLIVGRSFGLVRELIVASTFGASETTDAVYLVLGFLTTAMTIIGMTTPNAVTQTLYARGIDAADRGRVAWSLLFRWTLLLAAVAASIVVFAGPLGALLGGARSEAFRSTVTVSLRLAAPSLLAQAIVLPLMAVANAEGWHTEAAIVATGFPVGTVVGVVLLRGALGPASILAGVLLTSILQAAWLARVLFRGGIRPGAARPEEVRRWVRDVVTTAAPMIVGAALLKLDFPIKLRLASGLLPGDVFVFSLAGMVVNVPMSVANNAVGQAAIPELVRAVASRDPSEFQRVYGRTTELALLMIVPCAALLFVDAEPVVTLLFRRGRFDAVAAAQAAAVVRVWSMASSLFVLGYFMEEAITALGRSRLVALERGAFIVIMALLCAFGSRERGLVGLIVGFACAGALRFAVVVELLARQAAVARATLWVPIMKVFMAGAFAAFAASLLSRFRIGTIATVARDGIVVGFAVLSVAWALRVDVVRNVSERLGVRWRRA